MVYKSSIKGKMGAHRHPSSNATNASKHCYSSSSDSVEFSSKQEIWGSVRKSNSCQTVCMEVGWYSQNVWNLCSWKAGHSKIMCELSSLMKEHNRHLGSLDGSTFDWWYRRKLWPVRCLIQTSRKRHSCVSTADLPVNNTYFFVPNFSKFLFDILGD